MASQDLDQLFYLYGLFEREGKQSHLTINLNEVSDKDLVEGALEFLVENNFATSETEEGNIVHIDLTPEGVTYLESIAQEYQY